MEKILENYADVGTCGTKLYAKEGKLYYDPLYKEPVKNSEMEDLFLKGMVIWNYADRLWIKPQSMEINPMDGTCTIVDYGFIAAE